MQRLLEKGGDYYQCAKHMNTRGLADVCSEAGAIVRELKDAGKTFDDLLEYMEAEFKQKPDVGKDPFLAYVKKVWEMPDQKLMEQATKQGIKVEGESGE